MSYRRVTNQLRVGPGGDGRGGGDEQEVQEGDGARREMGVRLGGEAELGRVDAV